MKGRPALQRSACIAALAASMVLFGPKPAGAEVIERVVAVINEEAIFLSELRRRAAPMLQHVLAAESKTERLRRLEELYGQVLDRLIDDELIRQAAARMKVRVSREDVDRAIRRVRRQNDLGPEEFWQAVRAQGMSEAQYRHDLERQLLRLKVLNQRVRGRINLTEKDVRERYEQQLREANRELRFHASHCFVPVADDAGATVVAAAREQAAQARAGLSRESFDGCIDRNGGGDLGWLSEGDLSPQLEQALHGLHPGEVSDPVRGASGFHIFLLHDRERGGADIPPFEQVREQIFREMLDKAMARQQEQFLKELRREAVIDNRL